jgi:hypothetical protein
LDCEPASTFKNVLYAVDWPDDIGTAAAADGMREAVAALRVALCEESAGLAVLFVGKISLSSVSLSPFGFSRERRCGLLLAAWWTSRPPLGRLGRAADITGACREAPVLGDCAGRVVAFPGDGLRCAKVGVDSRRGAGTGAGAGGGADFFFTTFFFFRPCESLEPTLEPPGVASLCWECLDRLDPWDDCGCWGYSRE